VVNGLPGLLTSARPGTNNPREEDLGHVQKELVGKGITTTTKLENIEIYGLGKRPIDIELGGK